MSSAKKELLLFWFPALISFRDFFITICLKLLFIRVSLLAGVWMERRCSRFSLVGISTIAIYFRPIHIFARQSVMNVNATHHILTIIIILILSQVWLYDLHLFSITKIRLLQRTAAGSPACPKVYGLKNIMDRPSLSTKTKGQLDNMNYLLCHGPYRKYTIAISPSISLRAVQWGNWLFVVAQHGENSEPTGFR